MGEEGGRRREGPRQAFDGQARSQFVFDQQPRGVARGRDAQPLARGVGMGLDGAFADLEDARDLLRLKVLGDQPQNLFLAFRQGVDAGRPVPQIQSPKERSFAIWPGAEAPVFPQLRIAGIHRVFQRVFPYGEGYPQRREMGCSWQ